MTDVSVVIVAYGPEPRLVEAIEAVIGSVDVDLEIIVVDNECTHPLVHDPHEDRFRVVHPGRNTGFAGGCNLGAATATTPTIVFVNSDAVVEPSAIAQIRNSLSDARNGLVCAKIVLYDDPGVVNSVGNPVHYSLLSWAGGWGDQQSQHSTVEEVASATGCVFGVRTEDWRALGGFHEQLFAYGEDVELSLRIWLGGGRVIMDPSAVARHDYEFSRNPRKFYWLERNRLVNLLTVYQVRTLLLYSPILVGLELGMLATAVRQGWWREKVTGWGWILTHARHLAARRRFVQSQRRLDDRALLDMLTVTIDPPEATGHELPPWVNRILAGYGRQARKLVRGRRMVDAGQVSSGNPSNLPAEAGQDHRLRVPPAS